MKYSKMLCCVSQKTKKDLFRFTNKNDQFIFTENFDEFKNKISNDFYLVVSLTMAHKNLSDFNKLLQKYPNQKFRIVLDNNGHLFPDVIDVFTDEDKRYDHFTIEHLIEDFYQLREMAKLGMLGNLKLGKPILAYTGENNRIIGHPIIPKAFVDLQKIIPESVLWWLPSPLNQPETKGSTVTTIGNGSFHFVFTSESFFYFRCKYDPIIGFTKIIISYDDIDAKVSNPEKISIKDLKKILLLDYGKMLEFWLASCDLTKKQRTKIKNMLQEETNSGQGAETIPNAH